jgi:hypothetical protein
MGVWDKSRFSPRNFVGLGFAFSLIVWLIFHPMHNLRTPPSQTYFPIQTRAYLFTIKIQIQLFEIGKR